MGAGAVGKVTVDPNVGIKPPAQEGFWKADARLARKVTCQIRRKTVLVVLTALQGTTGVTLKAGYNSLDWQVRDRKMVIFAKDLALGDLMQSIARVMKFKWSRGGEKGAWSYRLFMDRRTVLESEAEAQRAEQRFNEEQIRKREALVDKLGDLAAASPADLARLKDENPYLYVLAASGVAGGLDEAFKMSSEHRDAFINNERIGKLPDGADAALRRILEGMWRMEGGLFGKAKPADLIDKIAITGIRINREGFADGSGMLSNPRTSRFFLGAITIDYTRPSDSDPRALVGDYVDISIADPESSLGKGLGRMLAGVLEDTGGSPSATRDFSFTLKPEEFLTNDFGEPVSKHQDEPALQETIEFKAGSGSSTKDSVGYDELDDLLAGLYQAAELNVVSDCLGKVRVRNSWPVGVKILLGRFLDGVSMMWSYNWWKNGSTLEFRDRHWFRKRSLQIPEVYLEKWRQTFETTGTLGLGELADMAVLAGDADKYDFNIASDEILGNQSMQEAVRWQMKCLRFYAALDSSQRSALAGKDGLDIDTLSADQRKTARECYTWGNTDPRQALMMLTTEKTGDGRANHIFRSTSGGHMTMQVQVTAPKYVKTKPKDEKGPATGK